ncbi:MAG: response regulator [Burkholderiaceae bacterium]
MTTSLDKRAPSGADLLRIFVVENHADTREFLTAMLEGLGHTVAAAETMGKALREIPSSNCDVLISDIGLPDGDGWELLGRLNLARPIFAIAMSGYGMTSDRARSKAAGYRHHLIKPMGLEQLETILEQAAIEVQKSNRTQPEVASTLVGTGSKAS